ncbi:MAG: EscU/YscU/HrcU family type III secretion system export apparatus switch protein [Gammaproteobacteria bacterium]|nr:EscU/YscU/HrcU family type III secretion system export apparatus switch protein [Gammaproteobacteria bacterium]
MSGNEAKPSMRKAVALYYSGQGAPRITAKGQGYIAEEILALAREHHIPLKEDTALVNLLARLELNEEIPEKLYIAVAEVIAFAWRLQGKRHEKT